MYTKDKSYNFNPRSPRGERRSLARGRGDDDQYFNPRSPRGERHAKAKKIQRLINFNPRSPRGERPLMMADQGGHDEFQSTLPARGATTRVEGGSASHYISIHAPREGSDLVVLVIMVIDRYFNPRSPRGERLRHTYYTTGTIKFQSTLPARGATTH